MKDFQGNGNEANGVISITHGQSIESVKSYKRPIAVEAEMKSSAHNECFGMTLFATNGEKDTPISLQLGGWATKWAFFPGCCEMTNSIGEMGSVTIWRKVKLVLDSETSVKFYIDEELKYTTDFSGKEGKLRFIAGCVGMNVRNIKIKRSRGRIT